MKYQWEPCLYRWNWFILDLADKNFSFCCKTQPFDLGEESFFNFQNLNQHPEILKSRENLLANKKDQGCKACWLAEDSNILSSRLLWKGSERFKEQGIDAPMVLQVVLDDHCNLECIYCGPERSSRWKKRQGIKKTLATDQLWGGFLDWFETCDLEFSEIHISGGEPLMSSRFHGFLEKINIRAKKQKNSLRLAVITNLYTSQERLRLHLDSMCALPGNIDIFVEFSNESRGAQAEYIRYGIKSKVFEENLEFICDNYLSRIQLGSQMTLNALSVTSLPEYLAYIFKLMDQYKCNIFPIANVVKHPEFLDPMILDSSFAYYFIQSNQLIKENLAMLDISIRSLWENHAQFILSMGRGLKESNEVNSLSLKEKRASFAKFIKQLDTTRNTNFASTFPNYKSFFESI